MSNTRSTKKRLCAMDAGSLFSNGETAAAPTATIPHLVRLFDLVVDPAEMHNVAQAPGNAARVRQMLVLLAEHLKATARQPAVLPKTDDPLEILAFCVQPPHSL